MSPADKAFETKVIRAASEIAERIADLAAPASDDQVLDVFKNYKYSNRPCSKEVLCAVFLKLDNYYSGCPNRQVWHPRLRSLRNNVVLGEELFALFR